MHICIRICVRPCAGGKWVLGERGDGCDAACMGAGAYGCDAATATVTTEQQLREIVGTLDDVACTRSSVASSTGTEALPALTADGECMVGGSSTATCEATHSNWRRVCKCIPASFAPTRADTPAPTSAQTNAPIGKCVASSCAHAHRRSRAQTNNS